MAPNWALFMCSLLFFIPSCKVPVLHIVLLIWMYCYSSTYLLWTHCAGDTAKQPCPQACPRDPWRQLYQQEGHDWDWLLGHPSCPDFCMLGLWCVPCAGCWTLAHSGCPGMWNVLLAVSAHLLTSRICNANSHFLTAVPLPGGEDLPGTQCEKQVRFWKTASQSCRTSFARQGWFHLTRWMNTSNTMPDKSGDFVTGVSEVKQLKVAPSPSSNHLSASWDWPSPVTMLSWRPSWLPTVGGEHNTIYKKVCLGLKGCVCCP